MALSINPNKCAACGQCVEECPNNAISYKSATGKYKSPEIDSEICVDCGLCALVCPADAIS